MKITNIEVISLGYMKDFPRIPRSFAIIQVNTNSGIIGYGEASSSYGYSYPSVIKTIVEDVLASRLIGEDPTRIHDLLIKMQKYIWPYLGWNGVGNTAIGAIEIALWDILGKVEGLPIYKLLGGHRDRIELYGTGTTFFQQEPAWHASFLSRAIDQGFKALKVRVGNNHQWDLDLVRVVRDRFGAEIKLMVDAYMTYAVDEALDMIGKFKAYNIYYMEEPLSFFRLKDLSHLTAVSPVPIAIGERIFSVFGFEEIVASKAANILQPDATIVGGIIAFGDVCNLGKANLLEVCPHVGGLTAIGIAANLHCAVANVNCTLLEYDLGPFQPLRDELIYDPIFKLETITDGILKVPEGPGLGIEINPEIFIKYPYKPGAIYPDIYPNYGFNLAF